MELLQAGVSRVGFTLFLVTFSLMRLVNNINVHSFSCHLLTHKVGQHLLHYINIHSFRRHLLTHEVGQHLFTPFPRHLFTQQVWSLVNGHPPSLIKFLTSSIGIGIGAAISELTDSATEVNSVLQLLGAE